MKDDPRACRGRRTHGQRMAACSSTVSTDRRKSLKAAAQICESGGNPDPCSRLRLHHRKRLPRTARTSSGSTPASTLITARPGNSIWIEPVGAAARAVPVPLHCSALPSRSPATACSALVGQHRGLPYDTRVATGTPGSHLLHAHGPLGQSKLPGQTWPLRCDASPPVFFATASGKGPLPQLHPYRSQGKRGTEKTSCLYGQKRTLTPRLEVEHLLLDIRAQPRSVCTVEICHPDG